MFSYDRPETLLFLPSKITSSTNLARCQGKLAALDINGKEHVRQQLEDCWYLRFGAFPYLLLVFSNHVDCEPR
jgi:hypothetical protein